MGLGLRGSSAGKTWGLILALFLAALVYWLPLEGLTPAGHKALALFTGIFVLYLSQALPLAITSLAVVPLAVLWGIAPLRTALRPFASPIIFLLLGAFLLSAAMLETGLANRLTFLILEKVGTTTFRITLGVTLVNIVLNFLIPSSTAKAAILLPPCLSIINLFKERPCPRFATNLLLTLSFTTSIIAVGVLTGNVCNSIVNFYLGQAGGHELLYLEWLKLGFPPALLMTFLAWFLIQKFFPPEEKEIPGGREFVVRSLKEMGPMDSRQKYTLGVFLVTVFLWVGGGWLHIDTTTACLFTSLFLFLPKWGPITWKQASTQLHPDILLITAGGFSLGDLLMQTGAAPWIAERSFSLLGLDQLSALVLLAAVVILCQFLHVFFVGATVMCTSILPILIAMGQQAGLPPMYLLLPAGVIISGYPLQMFYCTTPSILVYGTGKVSVTAFPKVGIPLSLIACFLYILCGAKFW